jgi:hypothetical protein
VDLFLKGLTVSRALNADVIMHMLALNATCLAQLQHSTGAAADACYQGETHHITAQHSTAQHSTAQHNTGRTTLT